MQLPTLTHLHSFAAGVAALLRPGDVITLSGPLGAGKTTLVKAVIGYLTGEDAATSPSFTIWQRYAGIVPVNHLDLYRIEDPREFSELGLEEAFDTRSCTIIEWPERGPHLIPAAALRLRLEGAGDDGRTVYVTHAD